MKLSEAIEKKRKALAGRPRTLSPEKETELVLAYVNEPRLTLEGVAARYGICRNTVQRILKRADRGQK
jgi:transposase